MNTETYKVGNYYNVTCIVLKPACDFNDGWGLRPFQSNGFMSEHFIPVAGPPHDDAEYIGQPIRHYHIDWRFAPKRQYDMATRKTAPGINSELGQVIDCDWVEKTLVRRLKCRRQFRQYPNSNAAKWLTGLQNAYVGKPAKNGICPHKGFDLTTLQPDADNCVICPLHGLKFNTQNWQLVERL